MFTNEGICLWFTFSETMFMVHSKKFQIEQVTFTTSDLNDFYDPWVDKTKINCMTNVITDGSTFSHYATNNF